jgi:hypothetical protein
MSPDQLAEQQRIVESANLAAHQVLATLPDIALMSIARHMHDDPDGAPKRYAASVPGMIAAAVINMCMNELVIRSKKHEAN